MFWLSQVRPRFQRRTQQHFYLLVAFFSPFSVCFYLSLPLLGLSVSGTVKTLLLNSPANAMRSPTTTCNSEPKPKSISKSDSVTFSLVENAGEYQPPPLSIYHPLLRRSPRFTTLLQNAAATDAVRMSSSPKHLRLAHAKDLRRSPRLNSSAERGNAEPLLGGAVGESGSKMGRSCWEKPESRMSAKEQEQPLRRCPRLSAGAQIGSHVVKRQRSGGQELPLNAHLKDQKLILDGKCFQEKSLGSSPRLSTQSECKSVCPRTSSRKILESLPKDQLVVVLSNNSNPHSDAKPCPLSLHKDNKGTRPFKHSNVEFFGENHLRQSPRLNPSAGVHASEAYVEELDVKLLDGMKLRRSPRLSSSSGNENLKVAVFWEKGTSKVDQNTKNSKVISTSIKLSISSDEQHSTVKTDEQHSKVKTISRNSNPGIHDTKCLRWSSDSSQAIISPSQIENGKTNFDSFALPESDEYPSRKKFKTSASLTNENVNHKSIPSFIGEPIPDDEAQKRWGWRYELKDRRYKDQMFKINEDEEDEIIVNVKCHYAQAKIGNCIFSLGDCAFIKGEAEQKYVGKIIEFFQTTDRENYFRVQWFYRIQDTVVQDEGGFHDKRRLFYSSIMNDNLIDCIIAKANVTHVTPRVALKLTSVLPSDFYYDMEYCVDYSTFRNIPTDNPIKSSGLTPPTVLETHPTLASTITKSNVPSSESHKAELALLDLYSGCGGMSTGLCLGAKVSSINLVTRWAVDSDRPASESLKLNHPDTHVRNESAEDFLELLKEWEKLCKRYKVNDAKRTLPLRLKSSEGAKKQVNSQAHDIPAGEYEVSRFVDICYGDPCETGKRSLYLKVHWKGYSATEDTWEPIQSLSKCQESLQDFVRKGIKSKVLPLPGDVDVICGGPPCQGISGYNRFRNTASPLDDERNHQIVVFMDMVKFLKPKYVLMENVVDILRFDKASLGRYALSRLVHMNYQARLGTVAAGCYGLPQFRLRVFLWGAHPSEVLPQFPLPTHDVIVRYWPPPEFERNTVAYDEDQPRELEKAIVIQDAISDLPAVTNRETWDEMSFQNPPETEFQTYIRSTKYEMTGSTLNGTKEERPLLYDHRPYFLHEDDYLRVCQIPKRKGANFRDLPGVVVGADNVVRRDPMENPLLPSGKPLIPDYALTFEQGKSKRPFARLWWDETVPTVLTFPSCHNQAVLHPEQDRVLTIREFARLQGFPDYYRFCGTVKERWHY